ncbi:MAG: hypothetical protein A2539_08785 [Elusimicrobia bacterium RIFOXYD2_FULL_34_15]|nr:MAG: hypothetical protein A2539_08785 [Elusimicrobia bacterium RIFOXYD2_FULL_34_15]
MQTVLLVCVILITIAFLVGTVHFVLTMIQVRQTAKETENLAIKINTASPLLNIIFFGSSMISSITSRIISLFSKKKEEE